MSSDHEALIAKTTRVIAAFKKTDPGHASVNLCVHRHDNETIVHMVFRNNHYQTSDPYQKIKSEGLGILEVSGMGIYPVPKDPELDRTITQQGLDVVTGIMKDNNPIDVGAYDAFFDEIIQGGAAS
jgi:galactose-1-phosphate uridylyltransferase